MLRASSFFDGSKTRWEGVRFGGNQGHLRNEAAQMMLVWLSRAPDKVRVFSIFSSVRSAVRQDEPEIELSFAFCRVGAVTTTDCSGA